MSRCINQWWRSAWKWNIKCTWKRKVSCWILPVKHVEFISTLDILPTIVPSSPWPDLVLWWITVMEIPLLYLSDCGEIKKKKEKNSFDLISMNRVIHIIETSILIIMIICLWKIRTIHCFYHADNCLNSSLHTASVEWVKIKGTVHDYHFICIIIHGRKGVESFVLKRLSFPIFWCFHVMFYLEYQN